MSAPAIRRVDKLMSESAMREMIATAYCGRLATVGPDGWPYVCPLLYAWIDGEIWVHNTRARGHLRANVDHTPKVCFEIDEPGEVFPYGRFECDTSVAYRSVVVFGTIRVVDDAARKASFFDAFLQKYAASDYGRPTGFYPRLEQVTVYAIAIERMTGKETPLPVPENRWPAVDMTKSPHAKPWRDHDGDTLRFCVQTGIRPMIETLPLARAGDAYERMLTNKVRFRSVLTMGS